MPVYFSLSTVLGAVAGSKLFSKTPGPRASKRTKIVNYVKSFRKKFQSKTIEKDIGLQVAMAEYKNTPKMQNDPDHGGGDDFGCWAIEDIVGEQDGKYKVKWQGWENCTLEPESNIGQELIDEYHATGKITTDKIDKLKRYYVPSADTHPSLQELDLDICLERAV
eukprot:310244_1